LIKKAERTRFLEGYSFRFSRICYSNGGIVKVVSDAGPEVETVPPGIPSELPRRVGSALYVAPSICLP